MWLKVNCEKNESFSPCSPHIIIAMSFSKIIFKIYSRECICKSFYKNYWFCDYLQTFSHFSKQRQRLVFFLKECKPKLQFVLQSRYSYYTLSYYTVTFLIFMFFCYVLFLFFCVANHAIQVRRKVGIVQENWVEKIPFKQCLK